MSSRSVARQRTLPVALSSAAIAPSPPPGVQNTRSPSDQHRFTVAPVRLGAVEISTRWVRQTSLPSLRGHIPASPCRPARRPSPFFDGGRRRGPPPQSFSQHRPQIDVPQFFARVRIQRDQAGICFSTSSAPSSDSSVSILASTSPLASGGRPSYRARRRQSRSRRNHSRNPRTTKPAPDPLRAILSTDRFPRSAHRGAGPSHCGQSAATAGATQRQHNQDQKGSRAEKLIAGPLRKWWGVGVCTRAIPVRFAGSGSGG